MRTEKCWIAVASAEHVRAGVAAGIMQVCHGKAQPLRRLRAGDRVAYYSPTETFRGGDRLQAFTAFGFVAEGEPYLQDVGASFTPFRRNVAWKPTVPAPAAPLLPTLDFAAGKRNWAYPLRFGLVEIGRADIDRIEAAMAPL